MPSPLTAVQQLSRWIRFGAILFISCVVAIYALTWIWPEITSAHSPLVHVHLAGISSQVLAQLTVGERLLVAAVSLPYLATLAWAFHRLVRMLRQFEAGKFFERETVRDLRAFSGLLLAAKVLALAAMHARVAIVLHLLGPRKGNVAIVNLSSDDLAILLLCALFFAIAGMMEEGRRLAEENRGFV
jgi:uncharacterized membrane protein YbaN (DUF454 family)